MPKTAIHPESQSCIDVHGCKHNHQCSRFCYKPVNELPKPKPNKSKDLCYQCRDNWYNQNKTRSIDGKGCSSFKSAKVISKAIPFSVTQLPPWQLQWCLSCYHKEYH